MSRLRRGAEAIEFALVMPILALSLVLGAELAWRMGAKGALQDAVRESCRSAAVVPAVSTPGPAERARALLDARLGGPVFGCKGGRCEVEVRVTGRPPDAVLECRAEVPGPSLTGLFRGRVGTAVAYAVLEVQQ